MKSKYFLFSILPLFLAMILSSCSDLEREKQILELNKTSLLISQRGEGEIVELTANGEWYVKDIPEWLSLSPSYGDYDTGIILTAQENTDFVKRNATLVFVRGDKTWTLEVEQLSLKEADPFIKLDMFSLETGCPEKTKTIELTTNRPWKVDSVPDWISVTPSSGDRSAKLTLHIMENRSLDERASRIIFAGESNKKALEVVQGGLRDLAIFPDLFIFRYKEMQCPTDLSWCKAVTDSMFINPAIREKIYIGNLVSYNPSSNTDIPEFTGYTFNPIIVTASAAVGEGTKTYIPSLQDQDAFAQHIRENMSEEDFTFLTNKYPTSYYTHNQLHAIGMVNLGIPLDKIMFDQTERTKGYGLVYSFKETCFTLKMDVPRQLIKEDLKASDKGKEIAYVSSVSYGRIGLLIVESETDSREVKVAIGKLIDEQPLSQAETLLLSSVDACYVYFDKDKNVQAKKGNMEAITAYLEACDEKNAPIYPLEFRWSKYADHSPVPVSFTYIGEE